VKPTEEESTAMNVWVFTDTTDMRGMTCEVVASRELAVAHLRRYIDEYLDHSDDSYPEHLLTDKDREDAARDAAERKLLPTLDDDAFLDRMFGDDDDAGFINNEDELSLALFDCEVQGLPAEAEAA
jgi:hypothetical protein